MKTIGEPKKPSKQENIIDLLDLLYKIQENDHYI